MPRTKATLATLVALAIAGSAAFAINADDTDAGLKGGTWVVTTLDGNPAAPGATSTLIFGDDDGIGGNGGCNVFGGSVVFEGEAGLDISEVFSTMMACEDDKMAQERGYFRALEAATGYTITDGVLSLLDADGTVLVTFERE